jgi:hypothetical protein
LLVIGQDPARKKERFSALAWWYRLTAPPSVPDTAPLAEREQARRGHLISLVMFFALFFFLIGTIIGLKGSNHFVIVAAPFCLVMLAISSQFNRRGYTLAAGLIIPLAFNLIIFTVILFTPLTPISMQLYDLLVFSEVFAASLLPPNGWILASFALGNIIFIQGDITFQPHTAAFAAVLATDALALHLRPVIMHVVITGVIWLWVRSASIAIARADRAEVIANLEHIVAEQEHKVVLQKQQLEQSIREIIDTHMRVANGDLSNRVPLSSENVLWQIAVPLNNLISRFQRAQQQIQQIRQLEWEYQRTRSALSKILYLARLTKAGQRVNALPQTDTIADSILQELQPWLKQADESSH